MEYSIIIPYHSNQILLDACLESLLKTIPRDVEIIIVANNSDVQKTNLPELPAQVKVFREPTNLYYPKAINLGAKQAQGDYLIFCDADTYYTEGWFEALTSFYRSHPSVGFAGSKLLNPTDESISDFGIAFTEYNAPHPFKGRPKDFPLVQASYQVQAVCAANSMIRKSLFLSIGGFNEALVHSYSDIDLSLRLKALGYETWGVADSIVFHKGNSTIASGMSAHLKEDTKGRFMRIHGANIKVDMNLYFAKGISLFLENHPLVLPNYCLIDFTTLADAKWHYDLFEELLSINIKHIYSYQVPTRDAPYLSLYETVNSNIRRLDCPLIIFLDEFRGLRQNQIWPKLRTVSRDLIIDRHANILTFDEL